MQRILALFLWTAQNCSQGNLSSRNVVSFLNLSALETYFWLDFFLREDNLLSHGLKCVTAITALLIDVKMFSELWYWLRQKSETYLNPFMFPRFTEERCSPHVSFSSFNLLIFFLKVKVKVKKVVTFECGCDDNWGIGIPFSQHWMPSTWCHKPLSQLWV